MADMKGIATLLLAIVGSGCAQVMVIRQPKPLDHSCLLAGIERTQITGALGPALATEERPDGAAIVDTYAYTDGGFLNSVGGKTIRIVVYTAGDIFTLFLAQVVWIPLELLFDGTDYTAVVAYERRQSDERWVAMRVRERERR